MAADGVNKVKLELVHGQQRHKFTLELPPEESGNVLTVGHLSRHAESLTEVPVEAQRLIHKGKSLKNQEEPLKALGIKDGSKIMLIGKKPDEPKTVRNNPYMSAINLKTNKLRPGPAEDVNMIALLEIEETVNKTDQKLSELTHELDGAHRGYGSMGEQSLSMLDRRLAEVCEELMRFLERLDALSLQDSPADVKAKRKTMVVHIQGRLDRCDGLRKGLNEMIDKVTP